MEQTIAGKTISISEDGYLLNANEWTKEIAIELAKEFDITLTDKHFELIDYLRNKHQAGESLTIRSVGKSGIADIKELYQLFPGGPLKISSKIAGIPKPTSCV
jgi:tRNA 2-thiouridine synthesizing protein E